MYSIVPSPFCCLTFSPSPFFSRCKHQSFIFLCPLSSRFPFSLLLCPSVIGQSWLSLSLVLSSSLPDPTMHTISSPLASLFQFFVQWQRRLSFIFPLPLSIFFYWLRCCFPSGSLSSFTSTSSVSAVGRRSRVLFSVSSTICILSFAYKLLYSSSSSSLVSVFNAV